MATPSTIKDALTYDDVLLEPHYSSVRPRETVVTTVLTRRRSIKLPIVSAPMDTVTEHALATRLALEGGIGIIHKNLPPERQALEVQWVKRFENGFIEEPMSVTPESTIADVVDIRNTYGYKKVPVVDRRGRLIGLITELDYFVPDDLRLPVKLKMQSVKEIAVARRGITLERANRIIRERKLWALPIVDAQNRLVSLVTRKDLEKNVAFPNAAKDTRKRLMVGAAIGVGPEQVARAKLLVQSGVDVLVIDSAHGHSAGVVSMLRTLRKLPALRDVDLIAGNVATGEGARVLAKAGADAVKVGVGPGSICTTRIVAGVGVPQLTAVLDAVRALRGTKVPVIADGGIRYSGDIVKALAAGASSVMLGGLLAGTDESPGTVRDDNGRLVKEYRGMGSTKAMLQGSKDRYGQENITDAEEFIPEGVEGTIPYRGSLHDQLHQLVGGVRAGMSYLGAKTIAELPRRATFVRITNAGVRESHPHSLVHVHRSKNYNADSR